MQRKLTRAVLSLVAFAATARAAGVRDEASHPPPEISLPAAGESYVDPVFGTKILRVTDERDGQRCAHAYAYWPALNLDASRLLLACDDVPLLYRFDGEHATREGRLVPEGGPKLQFEGASWSNLDPQVLYALDGMKLWRVGVAGGDRRLDVVRDFSGLFPYPFVLDQLSMSGDDRIFTFHSRDPSGGEKLDVVVYDAGADEVRVFDRGAWKIDESKVDKSGRWVLIDGAKANRGFRVWDLETDRVTDFVARDPEARSGGHEDLGRTLMVNGDGWETGLIARSYDAMMGAANLTHLVRYHHADGTLNWSIAEHVSLREDSETFVIGSTYGGDHRWGAFEEEIYLAYTDGTGFVRLAHTRSSLAAATSALRYWAQPRAVVHHSGRYVVYTSDLGSPTRTDVMLLFMPDELVPAGSTLPADGPAAGCAVGGRGGSPFCALLGAALLGLALIRLRR